MGLTGYKQMNNRVVAWLGFGLTGAVTKKETKENVSGFEVLGKMSSVLNMLSLSTGDVCRWRWPAGNRIRRQEVQWRGQGKL